MHHARIRTDRTRVTLAAAAVVSLLSLGTTACGDDDDDAAPTTAEFCAEAQASDTGDDSGPYDEFYTKHPEPTLADWAADGHVVTENIQEGIDQLRSWHPSEETQPAVDAAVAALEVIKKNSEDVVAAARGDQAALDALEATNQDTNVPAMGAAFEALTAFCAPSSGS